MQRKPITRKTPAHALVQTQMVAQFTAFEVVKVHGIISQPDDPDTCIVLPGEADPQKLKIKAGVVEWNLRRALVGALAGERVTALCGNKLCVRPDHLQVSKCRPRTRTRAEQEDKLCAGQPKTIDE